ncbi:MAG: LPXTG cell wall anchor domain-containing protein [Candidatus Woesearchaeota archaeon]
MKKGIIVLAVMAVLLSGCISFDVTEVISTTGESSVTLIYDIRALMEMMEEEESESTFCEEFLADPRSFMNPTCQDDDGLITIIGTVQHDAESFTSSSEGGVTEYTYYLSRGMKFLDEHGEDDVEEGFQGDFGLKEMGVTFDYTVEMPGELVSTTHGNIEGNRVHVNILEVDSDEEIVIVSRQEGAPPVEEQIIEESGPEGTGLAMDTILIIVGVIVLLGIVGLIIMKRKK